MRTRVLKHVVTVCLLTAGLLAAAQEPTGAAGTWRGAIAVPGMPLDVVVTLAAADGAWSGTIDIPAQGATGLPLGGVTVAGESVTFTIAGVPGDPTFAGTLAGDEIAGTFTQAGQAFPFALTRDAGDEPAAAGAAASYADPQGRFTVPVPTGWEVEAGEGFVAVVSPEGGVRLPIVVVADDDPEAAIARAWALAVPGFDLEPYETLEPPSQGGVDRSVVQNYDAGDAGTLYQAFAQVVGGETYVVLVAAEAEALQRRAAQVNVVVTGLELAAVAETDLSGLEPRPVAEVVPELEAFVTRAMEALGVPGASLAVVAGGEVAYAAGFGVTARGGDPVTPDTRMMIGSVGKSLTSLLTARLVDEGLLAWDTPAIEVLPEFAVADPELTRTITVRNLLCACTGVPRRDLELTFNAAELSAEDVVASLATFEFFTAFGEAFQYSNQVVATAGYVAAAAAGAAHGELWDGYAAALAERVLDPIGMSDTTLSFADVAARGDHAVPHQLDLFSGEYLPLDLAVESILLPVAPAGAHWSTANDMARYALTLLRGGVTPDGERVVSAENLAVTWEPQVPVASGVDYGLGWFVAESQGLGLVFHGGNTFGFTSELTLVPDLDLGLVVLTNAQGANAFTQLVGQRLIELLFDRPDETTALLEYSAEQLGTALADLAARTLDEVDMAAVEAFLGSYANPHLGTVTLRHEGGRLVLDAGEFQAELRPHLDRRGEPAGYVMVDGPLASLPVRLGAGEAGDGIAIGEGALTYAFEPID